ncbi:MAG: hypothetical protein AMS21_09970 [Gemmatimonas sp. SG8_38_2]|nr:MAG: hypothetical protein AMS21_09970 [Gemmatimonas sp. SG8_38_2]
MPYRIAFLTRSSLPDVYSTFVEAFSDYALDMSYMTEKAFENRAIKNGIDFECSVGAYEDDRMIGYTLIGLDVWSGSFSAFDIGTGIIGPRRGKGIARKMFEFAVPNLKSRGVERFVLEVLQDNEPAIAAYRRAGFRVTREFGCYELDVPAARVATTADYSIAIGPIGRDGLPRFTGWLDWQPSWENSIASIQRVPDYLMLLAAVQNSGPIGLLAYYPTLRWIMSLAVERSHRRQGVAMALMSHLIEAIHDEVPSVKMVNVLSTDTAMHSFLQRVGFKVYATQFEMQLRLSSGRPLARPYPNRAVP